MMKCKADCLFNFDGKCTKQSKKDMTVIEKWKNDFKGFISELSMPKDDYNGIMEYIDEVPNEPKWIPVSERLPDNTDPVNITWVNHDPESYYADIKDKPFTATGHYCNGRWWWYSVTCQDYLDEYGHWDIDAMDEAIEVVAWMPLPKPYEPQERSEKE